MNLPQEIISIIIVDLTICNQRNLIKCNKKLNRIKLKVPLNKKFDHINELEKYTIEYLQYAYLIPLKYINSANEILYNNEKLYKHIGIMNYKDIIKLLMKCNTNLQYSIMAGIAASGNLNLLKWARVNGCDWNTLTCSIAAARGHLNVLKWAHKNGCDWDSRTCSNAEAKGHLDILKWALANGCPKN